MSIPDTILNRLLIPCILTPATTVEEMLYLFKEQPQPFEYFAVVRISSDEYDILMNHAHHTILGFNYSLYGDGAVHLVQAAPPTA